jgi:hypothetical protein
MRNEVSVASRYLLTKGSVRILLSEGAAHAFTQVRKIQPPRAPPLVSFDKSADIGCGDIAFKVCYV